LLLSNNRAFLEGKHPSSQRLTVLILGSQHGTEPSGAEAILLIAREFLTGFLHPLLRDTDIILVPNANPDGREAHRRGNGNGVNLNTDFIRLSQPESRALNDALFHWQPEVALDIHESALLKKKSLGRQGYLTDFEAQFEVANNPNINRAIQALSFNLLSELIARIEARGLPAQRYIGEITSITQPITNGGLSLRNFRNKAGLTGAFSFLLENRLDPAIGTYPTPRNIKRRVYKQKLSIINFLEVIHAHKDEILHLTQQARIVTEKQPLQLFSAYTLDTSHPRVLLQLRKRNTGKLVQISFADHRRVKNRYPLILPKAYLVTANEARIGEFLARHHIKYQVVQSPFTVKVIAYQLATGSLSKNPNAITPETALSYFSEREAVLTAHKGNLWIDLNQRGGKLAALFFEPRSSNNLFKDATYADLVAPGKEFFIYRVEQSESLKELPLADENSDHDRETRKRVS
jgi:hypothetical protein